MLSFKSINTFPFDIDDCPPFFNDDTEGSVQHTKMSILQKDKKLEKSCKSDEFEAESCLKQVSLLSIESINTFPLDIAECESCSPDKVDEDNVQHRKMSIVQQEKKLKKPCKSDEFETRDSLQQVSLLSIGSISTFPLDVDYDESCLPDRVECDFQNTRMSILSTESMYTLHFDMDNTMPP